MGCSITKNPPFQGCPQFRKPLVPMIPSIIPYNPYISWLIPYNSKILQQWHELFPPGGLNMSDTMSRWTSHPAAATQKTSSGLPWEPWEVKDLGPLKQRPKTALWLYRHKICGIYRYTSIYIYTVYIYTHYIIYIYTYIYIYIWKSIIGFNTSSPKLSNLVFFFQNKLRLGGSQAVLVSQVIHVVKMDGVHGIFHHHPWTSLKHLPITRKMPFIPKFKFEVGSNLCLNLFHIGSP